MIHSVNIECFEWIAKEKRRVVVESYTLYFSSKSLSYIGCNKTIKVMRFTPRFWYGVRFAWLVQRGTPYCGRYNLHLSPNLYGFFFGKWSLF